MPPQVEQSYFLAAAVSLIGIAIAAAASRRDAAPTTDATDPAAA